MTAPLRSVMWTAAVVFVVKLTLIWVGWLDASVVADDAFYYFNIAKNLAAGLGPTFDGLAATNGFHPAWQYLLLPLWWIWPHELWPPVHAAQTISAALDLASAVLLYRIVRSWGDDWVAAAAAIIWLIWPQPFVVGLRGMEASLNAFAILLLFFHVERLRRDSTRLSDALVAGLLVGACGLARTDNLLLAGLTLLLCVFGGVIQGLQSTRARLRWISLAALSAAAVVSPWFVWSYSRFGSLIQVSALVKARTTKLVGALPNNWSSVSGAVEAASHTLFAPILGPLRYLCGEEFEDARWFPYLAAAVLVAGLSILAAAAKMFLRWSHAERNRLVFPLGYMGLHIVLYGLFLRSYSHWYAQPTYALLAILVALGAMRLLRGARRARLLLATASTILLMAYAVTTLLFVQRVDHTPKGPELRFMSVIAKAQDRMPLGRGRIGAFDAGAMGYVASEVDGVSVVNLDCLVNNAAYDALLEGRYPEYVASTIDVLVQRVQHARALLSREEYRRLLRLMKLE